MCENFRDIIYEKSTYIVSKRSCEITDELHKSTKKSFI